MSLFIKGPAAALGVNGRVYIELLAPGAGMILQFQQRFQCLAIALESKAAHQVGRFTGILCGQQRVDQALPHISGSVIIDLTGPEHPCGQRRPLDFRGDGVPVTQQLPEVGAFGVLHISKPMDVLDQVFLLCSNLFRRPGQCSFSLLLTLAFPAQSVIAQRGPTAGTGIFQTHIFRLLSDDRKTPCDTLPLGQADAGREKAAQNQDLYPKALCLTIFCCLSRPFGHGYSSLSICFHLPHMLFYPLHLVHQSPDLEVHHILRHLWE